MKRFLLLGSLFAASFSLACTNTAPTNNAAANQTPVAAATAAPTPAPVAGTNPDDEMYKLVEDQECRLYLASIKTVSDCKTVTQAERDKFAELHTKTLEATKKPLGGEAMRKARAQICLQTNNSLQKLVSQCKK